MAKHDLTSEIVDDIVDIMVLRVNEVVEKMRGIPGMKQMGSTSEAMAHLGKMSPEQRAEFFQQNPNALQSVMENIQRKSNA